MTVFKILYLFSEFASIQIKTGIVELSSKQLVWLFFQLCAWLLKLCNSYLNSEVATVKSFIETLCTLSYTFRAENTMYRDLARRIHYLQGDMDEVNQN